MTENGEAYAWDFKPEKADDYDYVLGRVSANGSLLESASDRLKDNFEIVRAAVNQKGYSLQYASERIRDSEEIVIEAVKQIGFAFRDASMRLKTDREALLRIVPHGGIAIKFVKVEFQSDPEIALAAVSENGLSLDFTSKTMKDDPTIVLQAVRQNGMSLKFASSEIKNNPDIVLEAVKQNGLSIEFSTVDLTTNLPIAIAAVQHTGLVYHRFLPETLRSNKSVTIQAVKNDASELKFAPEELQDDEDVVRAAIEKNGLAIQFVSHRFRQDMEFAMTAVSSNGLSLKLVASRLRNDKSIVMAAVENDGFALQYASHKVTSLLGLRNDFEVVCAAIENNPFSYQFASSKLQEDEKIIKLAYMKMTNKIIHDRSLSKEEKNKIIIRQKTIEFRTRLLYQNIFPKRKNLLDMYVERAILCLKALRFREAFEDFIRSYMNLSKYAKKDPQKVEKRIDGMQIAAEKIMKEEIKDDWIRKWIGEDNVLIDLFGKPQTEKELEQKRRVMCHEFVNNSLMDIIRNIVKSEKQRKNVNLQRSSSIVILQKKEFEGKEIQDEDVKFISERLESYLFSVIITWTKNLQQQKKKKISSENLIYLGIRNSKTKRPIGYAIEFIKKSSSSLVFRSTHYHLSFYGQFNTSTGYKEGIGTEFSYIPSISTHKKTFEGYYSLNLREGKGQEFSPRLYDLCIFEGIFSKGKRNGIGEEYSEETHGYVRGRWEEGELKEIESKYECPVIPFSKIESFLKHDQLIGKGAFGLVYKLESKMFSRNNIRIMEEDAASEFIAVKIFQTKSNLNRVLIFRQIKTAIELCNNVEDRTHILDVRGIIKGSSIGYLMEYCRYSIDVLVPTSNISMEEKCRILLQTAKGMKSLHHHNIMHRDLKWGNILINEQGLVKITDFDTAKENQNEWKLSISPHTQDAVGTAEFRAPEILLSDGDYGLPVDVYSFGLMIYSLLFEMNSPFSSQFQCICGTLMESITNQIFLCNHISKCSLRPLLDKSRIESIPKEYQYLISLAILCWDQNPEKRPTFEEIVEVIETESNKQKCYSIIQILVKKTIIHDQQQENKKKKKKTDEFFRPMKILLMKPSVEILRNQIEKKFCGSKVISLWYEQLQINIESDDDVLKVIHNDTSPTIIIELDHIDVKKSTIKKEEQYENEEEIEGEEEDDEKEETIKNLKRSEEKLRNEMKEMKEKLENSENERSSLKKGIEDIISELKTKKKEQENGISEDCEILLQRLTSLLFSDF